MPDPSHAAAGAGGVAVGRSPLTDPRRIARVLRFLVTGDWAKLRDRLGLIKDLGLSLGKRPCIYLDDVVSLLENAPATPPPLDEPVDIVIPVHNGYEHLDDLLGSLDRNTFSPHRVLLIDDASSDPRVAPKLRAWAGPRSHVELIENETNLGFAATVNRGASLARGDFVVLNTDVIVPPYWLERLAGPIRNDRRIASTTPFSNAASLCSFPAMNTVNELFGGADVEGIDAWFRRIRADGALIELPAGIAFCMGVNGDAWRAVGEFDAATFGQGYCEEKDWCMRADGVGYRHVLAGNLFVQHKQAGSFGTEERAERLRRNRRLLDKRHPRYQRRVSRFIWTDPARPLRELLVLLVGAGGRRQPLPLVVTAADQANPASSRGTATASDGIDAQARLELVIRTHGQGRDPARFVLTYVDADHTTRLAVRDESALEVLFGDHLPLGEIRDKADYLTRKELTWGIAASPSHFGGERGSPLR